MMRPQICVLLVLMLVSLCPLVMAQTITTETRVESPQRFAFEARFGAYEPDVDSNLDGTPYASTFGAGPEFYAELQFDWQVLRFYIGSLGIGGAIGHMKATGAASTLTGEQSEDETDLRLMPLTLLATLRFDYLAEELNVPLVPYFKFGFTYAFWWATNEDGVSRVGNETGYGGTAGLRIAGGLMLRLDWIEPRAARTFDNEFGVNHSYLFFEWLWAWVDGFGNSERMDVGDSTWVLGLALEF